MGVGKGLRMRKQVAAYRGLWVVLRSRLTAGNTGGGWS